METALPRATSACWVYRERCTASRTAEMTLTEDLEEAGSPEDLIVSQNSFPAMIPHRSSSKRRILIALRKKEKNTVVNEKCMWLQMLAGIRCQFLCLFKKSSALFDSEGGKNLLLRYLKLILFSFMWEDKLWFLWNYFILIVYFKSGLVFKGGLDLVLESLSYCSISPVDPISKRADYEVASKVSYFSAVLPRFFSEEACLKRPHSLSP